VKGFPLRLRVAVIGGVAFAVGCSALFASACKAAPRTRAHGTFPALGFTLGRTRVADVEGWARDHGVDCVTKQDKSYVECGRVPASMLGESAMLGVTGVWFRFDESGALASLQATRRDRDVSSVAGAFDRLSAELNERAGEPSTRTAVELSRGGKPVVERADAEFRAVVRATTLGDTFVLTEDYTRSD
jgi:hypothetical protein